MMKIMAIAAAMLLPIMAEAQSNKPYDESLDPIVQIDEAVAKAGAEGKHVICQVGGNWCRWCIMFADYVEKEPEVAQAVKNDYEYIHVNYPREGASEELRCRLGAPERFGFPVLVVLDGNGNRLHIQDSGYLEDGNGYDKEKVLRFLNNWNAEAIKK